jgi:hypothetical protein
VKSILALNSRLCVGKRQVNYQLIIGKSMAALGVIICISLGHSTEHIVSRR